MSRKVQWQRQTAWRERTGLRCYGAACVLLAITCIRRWSWHDGVCVCSGYLCRHDVTAGVCLADDVLGSAAVDV